MYIPLVYERELSKTDYLEIIIITIIIIVIIIIITISIVLNKHFKSEYRVVGLT